MQAGRKSGLHYTVFSPVHYEANYAYPLVVWLHGDGDDERQLARIMPLVSMRNYVAVAPRGPSARSDRSGYDWGASARDVSLAQQCVDDSIAAACERFHIAPKRIFLAGLQCGGTMAFRLGLQQPQKYAGVLSIGGPFPDGDAPLNHLTAARELPLFIAHGRDSTAYPVEKACNELRLFHAAGMSVTLRQYPCAEEVHVQMFPDMDGWIMEQVTGVNMSDTRPITWRSSDIN